MHRFIWLVITIICVLFVSGCGGIFFPLPYSSLAPFEGKVIDTETKEPIEGAVVLAVYYFTAHTIAGSNSYVEDGQETLTNKEGKFKLPRKRRWFVLHRGYPEGKLVIFKPGYGVFPRHQRSIAVGENKSWPPPGKYIVYELPRLRGVEERKENVISADVFDEFSIKKRNLYIEVLNEERKSLGLRLERVSEWEHQNEQNVPFCTYNYDNSYRFICMYSYMGV